MTAESRPVCVYALAGLKRNSTRLMIVMCVGIALALYGIYVQARSQSNPSYMPTISVAGNWLYESLGHRIGHPFVSGCRGKQVAKMGFGSHLMQKFVYPVTRYSGLLNGFINVVQIVLLKVYCKSFSGTDAIIGLSSAGLVISMICLAGSFAYCKLMCISCLGIHHAIIIYLSIRRRRILKNILCPSANTNDGACSFGSSNNSGSSGSQQKPSNSSSLIRRAQDTIAEHAGARRRSGRT